MTARAGMCSKQGDYEGCALVVFRLKKVSESTRKVQNVRQLITQIRQKVFQKGAFPAVIIYLERMVTIMKRFYTAESVTEGHPDKLCDLIADSILDACLKEDENSRVACEVLATKGNIIVAGEITSRFEPQVFEIIKKVLESAGYEAEEIHMDAESGYRRGSGEIQRTQSRDCFCSERTCQRCRGSGHHDWLRL